VYSEPLPGAPDLAHRDSGLLLVLFVLSCMFLVSLILRGKEAKRIVSRL
jgi:hypothetical protein